MIHFRSEVPRSGVDARRLKTVARALLREVHEDESGLSITLVDDARMRALNLQHRGKDKPTDVLSFPLCEPAEPRRAEAKPACAPEHLLGDVVISVDTARRQAADYGAPLQNEIYRLLIHGVLHVLGHDHERAEERRAMEAEERRLAAAIRMPWPYE